MGTRAALMLIAAVLTVAIWVESRHHVIGALLTPDAVSAERGGDGANESALLASSEPFIAPSITPVELMTETVSRPLFASTRRPAPVTQNETELPVAPVTSSQLPQVSLSAIVITDGDRVALLSVAGDEQLLRLREGQEVAGWRLTKVGAEAITLSQGGRTHEVALRTYQPAAAPAPSRSERRRDRRSSAQSGNRRSSAQTQQRPRRPRRGPRRRSTQRGEAE